MHMRLTLPPHATHHCFGPLHTNMPAHTRDLAPHTMHKTARFHHATSHLKLTLLPPTSPRPLTLTHTHDRRTTLLPVTGLRAVTFRIRRPRGGPKPHPPHRNLWSGWGPPPPQPHPPHKTLWGGWGLGRTEPRPHHKSLWGGWGQLCPEPGLSLLRLLVLLPWVHTSLISSAHSPHALRLDPLGPRLSLDLRPKTVARPGPRPYDHALAIAAPPLPEVAAKKAVIFIWPPPPPLCSRLRLAEEFLAAAASPRSPCALICSPSLCPCPCPWLRTGPSADPGAPASAWPRRTAARPSPSTPAA